MVACARLALLAMYGTDSAMDWAYEKSYHCRVRREVSGIEKMSRDAQEKTLRAGKVMGRIVAD